MKRFKRIILIKFEMMYDRVSLIIGDGKSFAPNETKW